MIKITGNFRQLINLIRWEIEKYLTITVFAFLIGSAIIIVLAQTDISIMPERNFLNLYLSSGNVFFTLTVVGSAFFSRSFAGSIEKAETKLLLSYPIKRWQLFLAKFTTTFLIIFIIYSLVFYFNTYLFILNPLEPLFFLSIFAFLLHLMFTAGVSLLISIATKNEIMSMLASLLFLLGLEGILGSENYFSAQGRFLYMFQYVGESIKGITPFGDFLIVSSNDFVIAILFPIGVFVFSFTLSFFYLMRIMEFD